MDKNFFEFYKVVKNEDAHPYAAVLDDGGFIVAADGLGGTGCYVHELSEEDNARLKSELKLIILPEFFDENGKARGALASDIKFFSWLANNLAPMTDGEPDTSALWASRIVITRFVYYLKENPELDLTDSGAREALVNFIYKGLLSVRDEFKLYASGLGRSTLPTTLVGIKYKLLMDGNIRADVVHAGDSRAYALIPGVGLKQLSEDDEDNSGAITNLFTLGSDGDPRDCELHIASYILPKKSAIFTCSDGFFDLFDHNLGVEAVLLAAVRKANSFEELSETWHDWYRPMHHDDCSVAFVAPGYDSYSDFKETFSERADRIVELYDAYEDYKKVIPVLRGEEETPDVYIRERFEQRKVQILDIVLKELLANPKTSDPAVTSEIKRKYNALASGARDDRDKQLEHQYIDNAAKIKDYLETHCPDGYGIIAQNVGRSGNLKATAETAAIYAAIRDAGEQIAKLRADDALVKEDLGQSKDVRKKAEAELNAITKSLDSAVNSFMARKKAFEDIAEALEELYNAQSAFSAQPASMTAEGKRIKQNILNRCTTIESVCIEPFKKVINCVHQRVSIERNARLPRGYDELLKEVREKLENYRAANNNVDSINRKIDGSTFKKDERTYINEYKNSVKYLKIADIAETLRGNAARFYTAEAIEDFGLLPTAVEAESVDYAKFIGEYIHNDPDIAGVILKSFMESSGPSVIDRMFNPGKLEFYRSFKKVDTEHASKIDDDITEVVSAYEDVAEYKA